MLLTHAKKHADLSSQIDQSEDISPHLFLTSPSLAYWILQPLPDLSGKLSVCGLSKPLFLPLPSTGFIFCYSPLILESPSEIMGKKREGLKCNQLNVRENIWSQGFELLLFYVIFLSPASLILKLLSVSPYLSWIIKVFGLGCCWSWLRTSDCATSCFDMLSEDFVITNNFFDYWILECMKSRIPVMKEKHIWIFIFLDRR